MALRTKWHPFIHDEQLIRANFTDFAHADDDFDPREVLAAHKAV